MSDRSPAEVWEGIHVARDWGKYPNEDLVRFVARRLLFGTRKRVLEIGCGTGANLWMLAREGFEACGIDISPTAIKKAIVHLGRDGLHADLQVGDVRDLVRLFPPSSFDAVIDVGTLMHLPQAAAIDVVRQAHTLLKQDGWFFSAECVADDCWRGPVEDRGYVHFYTPDEIEELYAGFFAISVEKTARTYNHGEHTYSRWIVEAVR
jgi:2-polyprenyl-3-methyl-5-hydroxy-6-metoxy-1,4-benzoquinol methylase